MGIIRDWFVYNSGKRTFEWMNERRFSSPWRSTTQASRATTPSQVRTTNRIFGGRPKQCRPNPAIFKRVPVVFYWKVVWDGPAEPAGSPSRFAPPFNDPYPVNRSRSFWRRISLFEFSIFDLGPST